MGSLITLAYLTRHADGLAGGVLCGFPTSVDDAPNLAPLLQGIDPAIRDEPAGELLGDNNAPFEPARTPSDWLSRDADEVDRFIDDPMSGDGNPLTFGYLADLFDVVAPAREHLGSISCPLLVIAGDSDPAAAMGAHAAALADSLRANGVGGRPDALRGRPPRAPERDEPRRGHRRRRRLAPRAVAGARRRTHR